MNAPEYGENEIKQGLEIIAAWQAGETLETKRWEHATKTLSWVEEKLDFSHLLWYVRKGLTSVDFPVRVKK